MINDRTADIYRLHRPVSSINSTSYLVYKYLFKDLKRVIEQYASGRVLDVGCGNKPYISFFNKIESYIGCDHMQSSLQLVDVICPATELIFDDNSFDTVFCTQTLEHIADHHRAFSEINRVLKPGGYFIFSVPFTWELHEEPFDYFRFTKYGIRFLIDKFGFEQIEMIPNGGKWAALGQIRINVIWSIFRNKLTLAKWHRFFLRFSGCLILLNAFYLLLDKWEQDDLLSLNYVCVARKIVSHGAILHTPTRRAKIARLHTYPAGESSKVND
jgi:SAM-dependent methyltransferase